MIDELYEKCCEILAKTWIINIDINEMKKTCIFNDDLIDDIFYDIIKYITIADYEKLITLDSFRKFNQYFKIINETKTLNCIIMFIENSNDINVRAKQNINIAEWCIKNNYLSYLKMLKCANCIDKPQKLFESCCEYGNIEIAKWLLSEFACIKIYNDENITHSVNRNRPLIMCCIKGKLEMAKWIYNYYVDNKITDKINWQYIFHTTCIRKQLACTQWIYSLDNTNIIINHYMFAIYCEMGLLDVAKWIYSICHGLDIYNTFLRCTHKNIIEWLLTLDDKIDIHADNEYVFINICYLRDLETAKWFYSLDKIKKIDTHAQNEEAFKLSIQFRKFETTKWLYSFGGINVDAIKNETVRSFIRSGDLETLKWFIGLCDNIDPTYIINNFWNVGYNNHHGKEIAEYLLGKYNIDIYQSDCAAFCQAEDNMRIFILSLYDTNEHYEKLYLSCCGRYMINGIKCLIENRKISKELFSKGFDIVKNLRHNNNIMKYMLFCMPNIDVNLHNSMFKNYCQTNNLKLVSKMLDQKDKISVATIEELFINGCIKYDKNILEFLITNFKISDELYDAGFVAGCDKNSGTVKFLLDNDWKRIGKQILENMFIESTNKGNKKLAHILLSYRPNLIILI
jgi:hypothetical protein